MTLDRFRLEMRKHVMSKNVTKKHVIEFTTTCLAPPNVFYTEAVSELKGQEASA